MTEYLAQLLSIERPRLWVDWTLVLTYLAGGLWLLTTVLAIRT